MKQAREEESLQEAVCQYIRMQYKGVVFISDASGIRVPPHVAGYMARTRSSKGIPDLIILKPKGKYHGLVLELKKENERVWLRDGTLSKNQHIQDQFRVLNELGRIGYWADFAIGQDHARSIIDVYMNMPDPI